MEKIAIDRDELKKIIKETIIDVLREQKDFIEDAIVEAIEDIGLARAMDEGRTGEYVDTNKFRKKVASKIGRYR